ncbi:MULTISPECIES: MFS transporter [Sphingomonas]|uniref:MFS transporter n=1 Tax=Sphingomonas TaxID=13687 RepID=UPI000DEEBBE2|nr:MULTISPECIES: MFS transporter [Sphingomonas]
MPDPAPPRPHAAAFVLVTILIDAIGFGIVIPVLPRLVMDVGHTGIEQATRIGGWLALTYAAAQFLLGPTIGNLGDHFGRRKIILGCLACLGIDYLLMAVAQTLPLLFLGRLLAGIFGSTYGPCQAALADITAPRDRARLFGFVGAAFGLGFIVGPALGGFLGELGPRAPFIAAAVLAGVNFVYGLTVFPETLRPELRRPFDWRRANPLGALGVIARTPALKPVVACYLLWQIASLVYPSIWAYWGVAAFGWTPAIVGASLAAVGVLMATVQGALTGRIVYRLGERRTAQVGLLSALGGFVGFALATSTVVAFAILPFMALQSLVQPSLSAMLSQRVPANAQGEIQGIGGSVMSLGAVIAPLLYNPALAHFTAGGRHFPGAPFVIAAAFAGLTFAALGLVPKRHVDPAEPASAAAR